MKRLPCLEILVLIAVACSVPPLADEEPDELATERDFAPLPPGTLDMVSVSRGVGADAFGNQLLTRSTSFEELIDDGNTLTLTGLRAGDRVALDAFVHASATAAPAFVRLITEDDAGELTSRAVAALRGNLIGSEYVPIALQGSVFDVARDTATLSIRLQGRTDGAGKLVIASPLSIRATVIRPAPSL